MNGLYSLVGPFMANHLHFFHQREQVLNEWPLFFCLPIYGKSSPYFSISDIKRKLPVTFFVGQVGGSVSRLVG